MNELIVALVLVMIGGLGGTLLCAQAASSKPPEGQEIVTGVAPLPTDHVSVFGARESQTVQYPWTQSAKLVWRFWGGSLLVSRLNVEDHLGDKAIRKISGRAVCDYPYDDLLQPNQRLPVRVCVKNGQVQNVEVFPPVLYSCRVDQVEIQRRAIQITRDRDSSDKLVGGVPWPEQVETLKVWLPLAEKAIAHRNFAEVKWSDLAGQSRVVVWLNTQGEVFHLDAFDYDTMCWRTTVDPEERVLTELKDKGWESYEVVRRLKLSPDVRVYDEFGREIALAEFPVNIYEVPLHTWLKLDEKTGEATCVIISTEPE